MITRAIPLFQETSEPVICTLAAVLLGPEWTRPQLARLLGWDLRRVQRWCSGREAVPPGVTALLRQLVCKRRDSIDEVLGEGVEP